MNHLKNNFAFLAANGYFYAKFNLTHDVYLYLYAFKICIKYVINYSKLLAHTHTYKRRALILSYSYLSFKIIIHLYTENIFIHFIPLRFFKIRLNTHILIDIDIVIH